MVRVDARELEVEDELDVERLAGQVNDHVRLDGAQKFGGSALGEKGLHLLRREELGLTGGGVVAIAGREGEAARGELLEPLLGALERCGVLEAAQEHGARDGLPPCVVLDDLETLFTGRAALEVLKHDVGASLVSALLEGLPDLSLEGGVDDDLDDLGCGSDVESGGRRPGEGRRDAGELLSGLRLAEEGVSATEVGGRVDSL
ncbi:hypothetical protein [Hyalangium versicolor]|uniref:hypothetical protein n=1 Tax=Hyalangium versicolor TaxID=2861190 RepID=UPI001CCC2AA6|nr:hypothetical protein [Hyalangium versicolor]